MIIKVEYEGSSVDWKTEATFSCQEIYEYQMIAGMLSEVLGSVDVPNTPKIRFLLEIVLCYLEAESIPTATLVKEMIEAGFVSIAEVESFITKSKGDQ